MHVFQHDKTEAQKWMITCMNGGGLLNKKHDIKRKKVKQKEEKVDRAKSVKQQGFTWDREEWDREEDRWKENKEGLASNRFKERSQNEQNKHNSGKVVTSN